jgi:4-amino-4-deoxy-L-arabinose transferase-like glycosyltransferase
MGEGKVGVDKMKTMDREWIRSLDSKGPEQFMNEHVSKNDPREWIHMGILVGVCLIIYFINLGQWDLRNPDEPRYAQVAREMVRGGDWILMHFNGATYPDKPPLFFWLIALSSFLWQGFTSFSARFPSALFGTLTVVLTFLLGRRFYSTRTGFLSGLILATSYRFADLSVRAGMDTTLTFFTTASLFCFIHWHKNMKEGRECSSIYGFYVGMALGTLTKGPVGLFIPLLVGLVYLIYEKDWQAIRRMRLLTGLLLFMGITLAWYLPAVMKGGRGYLQVTLIHHTVNRYVTGWSQAAPFYFYFFSLPGGFLPWSFFLPGAVAYGYSKVMTVKKKEFFFLLIWCVVTFVFFSLSKDKRHLYLLPLYPAVALLVGKLLDDFMSSPMEHFKRVWVSLPLYVLAGLTLLGSAAVPVELSVAFPSYLSHGVPVALASLVGSLAILMLNRQKQWRASLIILIAMTIAGFLYEFRVVSPLLNPYKSARLPCQEAASRIQPGEKLAVYRLAPASYVFYTGVVPVLVLRNEEQLASFLQASERVYCFVDAEKFDAIKHKEKVPRFELIARYHVGGSDVLLISSPVNMHRAGFMAGSNKVVTSAAIPVFDEEYNLTVLAPKMEQSKGVNP